MQTSSKTSFLLLLWVHLQLLPALIAGATALHIQVWAISWIHTKGYSSRSRGKHRPGNLAGGVWFCNATNPHNVYPSASCLCHTTQWAQVLADVCPWAILVTAFFPGFLLELTLSFFCLKITQHFSSPWKLCAEASPLKSMETQQSPFRVITEVRGRFCEQLLPASLTKGIKFTLSGQNPTMVWGCLPAEGRARCFSGCWRITGWMLCPCNYLWIHTRVALSSVSTQGAQMPALIKGPGHEQLL